MKILKIIFWIILALITLAVFRYWLLPFLDNGIYKLLSNNAILDNKAIPQNQEGCLKGGGDWAKAGLAPKETCRFPAKDAGKKCIAGFQCQFGQCVGKLDLHKPAIFATGACARYKSTFGCTQTVHFGLTSKGICRD